MAKKYDSILQSIITKLSKLLVPASKTSYGLMSPSDKTKLDDIKDEVSVSDTEPATDSGVKLWMPTSEDDVLIPIVSDDEVSSEDTWSSEKINNTCTSRLDRNINLHSRGLTFASNEYVGIPTISGSSSGTLLWFTNNTGETIDVTMEYYFTDNNDEYVYVQAGYGTSNSEGDANYMLTKGVNREYNKDDAYKTPDTKLSISFSVPTGKVGYFGFYSTVAAKLHVTNVYIPNSGYVINFESAAISDQLSNPNLLINPDFRINQRGKSSYSSESMSVDGWMCTNGTSATVLDTGEIQLTTSASDTEHWAFCQNCKNPTALTGKRVTVSVYVSAISGSTDWVIPSAENTKSDVHLKVGLNTLTEQLISGSGTGHILTTAILFGIAYKTAVDGGTITLKYMKVEIGDTATPFIPPNPEEELLKCRERYQTFTGNLNPYQKTAANVMQFAIPAPHAADGTTFTAAFKDTTKFNVRGGVIVYNISSTPTMISMSNFALVLDPSVKQYYLNVPLPTNLASLTPNQVLLSIGINCPIEFTNE